MFQQRKNKRFNYKLRQEDSNTNESKDDFETKWNEVKGDSKGRKNVFTSLPVLIIALVLLFVLIYTLNGYIK